MAKQPRKVYIESDIWMQLLARAKAHGFEGRGSVAAFMAKIARHQLIFLDDNTKELVRLLLENESKDKGDYYG